MIYVVDFHSHISVGLLCGVQSLSPFLSLSLSMSTVKETVTGIHTAIHWRCRVDDPYHVPKEIMLVILIWLGLNVALFHVTQFLILEYAHTLFIKLMRELIMNKLLVNF